MQQRDTGQRDSSSDSIGECVTAGHRCGITVPPTAGCVTRSLGVQFHRLCVCNRARDWFWREAEYPPHAKGRRIFTKQAIVCNATAKGVFYLLTGICENMLDSMKPHARFHDFDPETKDTPCVYFIEFQWHDSAAASTGDTWSPPPTNYHALVYYDGMLYQSYRSSREWRGWWLHSIAYPAIQSYVKETKDRAFFETQQLELADDVGMDSALLDVFNRLCAPHSAQLASDVWLRKTTCIRARVAPHRSDVVVPLVPSPDKKKPDDDEVAATLLVDAVANIQ